jgi:hypothetical protein
LQTQAAELSKMENDLALQKEIFFEGFRRLRRFLESRFEFFVPGATSREFVIEFRAALLVWKQKFPQDKIAADLSQRIEALASQTDAAVYAQNRFESGVVKAFVEQIRTLHKELHHLEEKKS